LVGWKGRSQESQDVCLYELAIVWEINRHSGKDWRNNFGTFIYDKVEQGTVSRVR